MEKKKKSGRKAGDICIGIGAVLAGASIMLGIAQIAGGSEAQASLWVGIAIGFGLVIIGYMQRIAAK